MKRSEAAAIKRAVKAARIDTCQARAFCKLVAAMQTTNRGVAGAHDILGPAELLLQHGQPMMTRIASTWQGTQKLRFHNAYQHARRSRGRLRYVEGFAIAGIPIEHAWCVDEAGQVIDPTLRTHFTEADYFGMVLDLDFVRTMRRKHYGTWSILFCWWEWTEIYPAIAAHLKR